MKHLAWLSFASSLWGSGFLRETLDHIPKCSGAPRLLDWPEMHRLTINKMNPITGVRFGNKASWKFVFVYWVIFIINRSVLCVCACNYSLSRSGSDLLLSAWQSVLFFLSQTYQVNLWYLHFFWVSGIFVKLYSFKWRNIILRQTVERTALFVATTSTWSSAVIKFYTVKRQPN